MPNIRSMPRFLKPPFSVSLTTSALVFLIIIGIRSAGYLESLELSVYDWYIRLRPQVSARESRITLITITEQDIHKQGRWPLSDKTIAEVLENLAEFSPRAIGLDIYRDIPVPPGHRALEEILTKNNHIITIMKFGKDINTGIGPPPILKDTDQVGFSDIIVDPGGIVRRGILFMDDGETTYYSFALRLALLYLQAEGIRPQPDKFNPQYIRLGQTTIRPFESNDGGYIGADASGYQFLLDFKDSDDSFRSVSLANILSDKTDPKLIKDKIVIIGVDNVGVKDFFYTPYSRELKTKQHISGIALNAHIVSQLLRFGLEGDSCVTTSNKWVEWLWILAWGVMGGIAGLMIRSHWRFSFFVAGIMLFHFFIVYLAFLGGWWIPLVPSALSWFLSAVVVTAYISKQEKEQRTLLMEIFSKHVSKEIADTLWQKRDQFLDGKRPRSQKMIATVLFTDLKGFTSVSEKMEPQQLMDWLNTYMEPMAELVVKYDGVVDDYAGDGLKANFGVPFARKTEKEISRDAVNAVDCALEMQAKINELNTHWHGKNLPTVGMRIGIFTGLIVAGSLGSAQRLKYTTIGDTINVASRLESLDNDIINKSATDSSCRILAGEATIKYLNQQFNTEKIGKMPLKGKNERIIVYRIISRNKSLH